MKKQLWVVLVIFSIIFLISTATAEEYVCFFQTDPEWAYVPYGRKCIDGVYSASDIGYSGCGLLSLTNAVYALNGTKLNPADLAAWSLTHGCRVDGQGTTHDFPEKYIKEFGDRIGVRFDGDQSSVNSTVRNHIQNGGVAVINVVDHFACLVDYDASTGKYLALDSYPSSNRGTYPSGKVWLTENQLRNHWKWETNDVHLLSSTNNTKRISFDTYGVLSTTEDNIKVGVWLDNPSEKLLTTIGMQCGTNKNAASEKAITGNVAWTRSHLAYDVSTYFGTVITRFTRTGRRTNTILT